MSVSRNYCWVRVSFKVSLWKSRLDFRNRLVNVSILSGWMWGELKYPSFFTTLIFRHTMTTPSIHLPASSSASSSSASCSSIISASCFLVSYKSVTCWKYFDSISLFISTNRKILFYGSWMTRRRLFTVETSFLSRSSLLITADSYYLFFRG